MQRLRLAQYIKSLAAAHPLLRERLSALALLTERLSAKTMVQRLGRHWATVEAWGQRFTVPTHKARHSPRKPSPTFFP
jgi:hypothetical protein